MLLLQVMIDNRSKLTRLTKPLMFLGLRLCVPIYWVLIISSAFATASISSCSVSQLWLADPKLEIPTENSVISQDISEHTVDQCTSKKVSCDEEEMMNLSSEQKQVVKFLYKNF